MCAKCDGEYYVHMKRGAGEGVMLPWFIGVMLAIIPGIALPALLPVSVAFIFLGFPGILLWRRSQRKRKFFALMRARGALPAPDSKVTDADVALANYDQKIKARRADAHRASFAPSETGTKPDATEP